MNEIRNKSVYEAAKTFIVATIGLLVSHLQHGESIPSAIVEESTVDADGSFRTDFIEKPMPDSLIYTYKEQIQHLPEYDACIRAMNEDLVMSRQLDCSIGTSDVRFHWTAWEYLSHLLERQVSQWPTKLEFDPQIFHKTYYDLEQFFYSETIPSKALSPLHNFDCDSDRLELEEGLCIRRVEKEDLEALLNEPRSFSQLSFMELALLEYVIEFDYETKKEFGELLLKEIPKPIANPWEKTHKLLAALRLYKQGDVNITIIKTSQTLDVPILVGRTTGAAHSHIGQNYELKEAELEDFRRFWNCYKGIDLARLDYLGVALRRFNYAYERGNLEDKLIDYLISFEALFFKENETGEFRHKLSVRVSRFLEEKYDGRQAVAKTMSDFYEKRSRVVHGEKVELEADYVTSVEDYLRRSIRLFLERLRGSNHDDIISRLDLE